MCFDFMLSQLSYYIHHESHLRKVYVREEISHLYTQQMKYQQTERNLPPVPKLPPAWWNVTSSIHLFPITQHQRRGMKEAQEELRTCRLKKKKKKIKDHINHIHHWNKLHHLPTSGLASSLLCAVSSWSSPQETTRVGNSSLRIHCCLFM